MQDTEKAEVGDAFCTSVFTGKSLLGLPIQETYRRTGVSPVEGHKDN